MMATNRLALGLALALMLTVSPSVAAAAPDLVLTNFSATVAGTTVTYDITVCNVGSDAKGSFAVELYYHRSTAPGCSTPHSQVTTVSGLLSGHCTLHSFTRTGAPAGAFTAWARADADCAIKESNEGNNNASFAYGVNLPDLVLSNLAVTVTGTTVTYDVTVCNQGAGVGGSFDLELYYHRTSAPGCATAHDQVATISGLASGNCTLRSFTRTASPAGVHTAWALADAGCEGRPRGRAPEALPRVPAHLR